MTISLGTIVTVFSCFLMITAVYFIVRNLFWFSGMEKEVTRLNWLLLGGRWHLWQAGLVQKKIQLRLENAPLDLIEFVKYINPIYICAFQIEKILELMKVELHFFQTLSTIFSIASRREIYAISNKVGLVAQEMIIQKWPDILRVAPKSLNEPFDEMVVIPKIKEILTKCTDISTLERLKSNGGESLTIFAGCLIEERKLQLLKNDQCREATHFFEIFRILTEGPALNYWIEEFGLFLQGKFLPEEHRTIILLAANNFPKIPRKVILMVLDRFVPELGDAEIDEWFSHFAPDSLCADVFLDRLRALISVEDSVEALGTRYHAYAYESGMVEGSHGLRQALEIFESQVIKLFSKVRLEMMASFRALIHPKMVEARRIASDIICDAIVNGELVVTRSNKLPE